MSPKDYLNIIWDIIQLITIRSEEWVKCICFSGEK